MHTIDAFESAFRSANKPPFRYAPPAPETVLVVSDLSGQEHAAYEAACHAFLAPLAARNPLRWIHCGDDTFRGAEGALRLVEEHQPDLIITYRNLNSDAWAYAYSLGVYLNAMTRGTTKPVLVTPNPHAFPTMAWKDSQTDQVMAIDENLQGDDGLLNWAAALTRDDGKLHLTHMENDEIFERYMDAISKIPAIDTDVAREKLMAQLLKEPTDYIASAAKAFAEHSQSLEVVAHVGVGHRVADMRDLIAAETIDLVVFPTLEEDRIALHGAAYSLAVELTETPLLMV